MSLLWDYNFYIGKNIGKYKVKDVLGVGGMGVVYKAEHIYLNTEVAIKLLLPNERGKDWHKRFLREARVLAELKHPNIIEIYDFDFTEEGYPYYVMEMLEGVSLKDYLIENGTPEFERFKDICMQIGEALFYAHSKGIIHRDLKPSNIFLTWEGKKLKVKIVDFGIAKLIAKKEGSMTLTRTTDFLGTPYYVAPEQVLNQDIGPHTDIYSFGLIVAEMLLGKPVRDEKSLGEILGVEIRKPVDLSDIEGVNGSVVRAVYMATHPDITERFQNVRDFVKEMFQSNKPDVAIFVDDSAKTLEHTLDLKKEKYRHPTKLSSVKFHKKGFLFLVFIFLIILSLIPLFFKKKPKKIISEAQKLILLKKQIEVPPDSSHFLGSTGEVLFLATADSIYSVPFRSNGKLWLSKMVRKENIIGFDRRGSVFIKEGDTIYKVFLPSKKQEIVVKNLPEMNMLKISATGDFLAGVKKNMLNLFSLKNKKISRVFTKKLPFTPSGVVLNKKYVFVFSHRMFVAYLIQGGGKIINETLNEIVGTPVATIQQNGDYVAFGGWSDSIYLINLRSKAIKEVVFPGKTTSLLFIPDTRSLLIAKENKLGLYRNGKIHVLAIPDSLLASVDVVPGGFSLLDVLNHQIIFVSYRDTSPLKVVKLSSLELWSMEHYKENIFAGTRDGKLFEVNTATFKAREVFRHNEGLTAMLVIENFLITASDDRTIGLFTLPEVKLTMRTKAHSYLINYLFKEEKDSSVFWSSSSDGTIRKWVLPDLTQEEVIKAKKTRHFAAFSIIDNLLIAGTWDKQLLIYGKEGKKWKLKKEFNLASQSVYSMCYLKPLNIIVGGGIYPSNLYLLDLNSFNLYFIPEAAFNLWIVKSGDNECIVFGNGHITKYSFERRDGSIFYKKYSFVNTDMLILTTGILTNKFLVSGSTDGKVFFFEKNKLPFQMEEKSEVEKIF